MPITEGHKQNFETLRRAMLAGDAALVDCQLTATGEPAVAICAINRAEDGSIEFVPLAMLFSDDPYRVVNPPNPAGGFYSQDWVHGAPDQDHND